VGLRKETGDRGKQDGTKTKSDEKHDEVDRRKTPQPDINQEEGVGKTLSKHEKKTRTERGIEQQ